MSKRGGFAFAVTVTAPGKQRQGHEFHFRAATTPTAQARARALMAEWPGHRGTLWTRVTDDSDWVAVEDIHQGSA